MSQVYHSNARTNQHVREIIQNSDLTNVELAKKYNVNVKTIAKHRNRDFTEDKSSRPNKIEYALTPLEKELIRVVRTLTWMELDDLTDTVADVISKANRSNVYRTLKAFDISRVPVEEKAKAKQFKEYEPGYLHIDVTYLPKFDKQKYYLFVAIDRATRLLYYKVYENKTAANAVEFLKECKEFFPFYISHILTDNGLEFTDKWARGKGEVSGNHKFDVECKKDEIEHRLTAPYTPQTNGMVERVNGTIKNATIKAEDYDSIEDVKKDLNKFLIYYTFNRRHGSLRKELKVRTPFDAVQSWFQTKPEIFKILPDVFQDIAFGMVQRGET
ncbi:MAG: integrase core domain-containing protein [Bacteroidales bacterium]|nr:integrase core domain-containing protein [Bacteroidales bacterium]